MSESQGTRFPGAASILALVSLPIFIGALDLTVVSAVLPHVIYDLEIPLQSGLDNASWIVSGYLLTYAIAMAFMGRLSDIFGRRRIFLLALMIFALGSYLVAVADGWPTDLALRGYYLVASGRPDSSMMALTMIIVARMIQAFGAGAMVPVGMALVGDMYPMGARAKPLGVIAAIDTAGWVVGHLYGGIVVRFLDWRMIFWLNLPVCLIAFGLIAVALRKLPQERRADRMDWLGALLISMGLTALTLGLGGSGESGTTLMAVGTEIGHGIRWPLLILSLAFFAIFVLQQARSNHALMPIGLFRRRNLVDAGFANLLLGFSLFVAIVSVPLFINTLMAETIEQGAWDSGWMLSALTVPMALAAIPSGWLTDRLGYRWPSISGMILAVGGFTLMLQWNADSSYAVMASHLVITGIGFGLTITPIAAAVVNAADQAYRGSASALVILFRLVGMTIGVSSMTTYGLQRATRLSAALLQIGSSYEEMMRVGIQVAERVIHEMFLIAAAVCLLSLPQLIRLQRMKEARRRTDG
ncbi:MAG TPA: MFS transporter [Anaerolineae bacterium]|nr:MFS transporter [Anaerolineae bacterium]